MVELVHEILTALFRSIVHMLVAVRPFVYVSNNNNTAGSGLELGDGTATGHAPRATVTRRLIGSNKFVTSAALAEVDALYRVPF